MELRTVVTDAASAAIGRSHRDDPVTGTTGGPAGNARLTAWTGMLLLILFVAELVTIIDVRSMISWHVVIGVVLIPPALLKTATTGWRIVRYYTGARQYEQAGPPPLLFRVLGPLVVASTLGVLGSGLALIWVHPTSARQPWLGSVSVLMIHKGMFVVWAVVTGLHTLGRLIPALRLTIGAGPDTPGRAPRISAIGATLAIAAVAGALAYGAIGAWRGGLPFDHHRDRPANSQPR